MDQIRALLVFFTKFKVFSFCVIFGAIFGIFFRSSDLTAIWGKFLD
jgi:hypothetical protein